MLEKIVVSRNKQAYFVSALGGQLNNILTNPSILLLHNSLQYE